jgi:apolipoprotein N-acyltransferase
MKRPTPSPPPSDPRSAAALRNLELRDAAPWRGSTLALAAAGSLLLWASFPPLDLWPLAWAAPLPWLWLIRAPQLPGWRPYLSIWLAGFGFWLAMLQGIRLAHPALYAGWIALSWYLAFYLPVFVGLSRVAVHQAKIPLVLAAPLVWTALELVRGHLLTGFSMGLLAHTQTRWPLVLQIADLGGAYAVSFVMMLVAAALASLPPLDWLPALRSPPGQLAAESAATRSAMWPMLLAGVVVGLALAYGSFRLAETPPHADREPLRIALIQGSLDTVFEIDDARVAETLEEYQRLTDEARRRHERIDLVVWPESMFLVPELRVNEPLGTPADAPLSPEEFRQRLSAAGQRFEMLAGQMAARVNTLPASGERQDPPAAFLFATSTYEYGPGEAINPYNAALLADEQGKIVARYYKQHPVMFGEYIPFAAWMPWLYKITPLQSGLTPGPGPTLYDVQGTSLSPSICFESVVPHLIRRQVNRLAKRGTPPDVLVNLTNDGWFWGTAMLDLHARCAVFRAIENRKPMVVAANTGISIWVDGNGQIRAQGPRRDKAVLLAEVRPDGRTSLYTLVGDWPWWLAVAACVGLAGTGWRHRTIRRRASVEIPAASGVRRGE